MLFMGAKGKARKTQRFAEFKTALMVNGVVQFLVLATASMILDGGFIFCLVLIACLAYWLTVLWVGIRRPNALTGGDASMIRIGFVIYFPITLAWIHAAAALPPW